MERVPLRETSANALQSPIKLHGEKRREGRDAFARPRQAIAAPVKKKEADDDLSQWQTQWRRIMSSSTVYFDGVDSAGMERVKPYLGRLDTKIQPFFDRSVTHLVTKRPTDTDYPTTDIITRARLLDMKVWTTEKLARFLCHLYGISALAPPGSLEQIQHTRDDGVTVNSDAVAAPGASALHRHAQHSNKQLSYLLKQEKLLGPMDRDPNAPSDNFRVFKGPYLLVWDPTHCFRPTLHKEFAQAPTDAEGDWPQFRVTPPGHCPFVYIAPEAGHKRRHESREAREKSKSTRALGVRKINDVQIQTVERVEITEVREIKKLRIDGQENAPRTETSTAQSAGLTDSVETGMPMPSVSVQANRFYEIAASGINRSTTTSATRSVAAASGEQQSGAGGANGLAATVAQVPSREIAHLQRKVLSKPFPKGPEAVRRLGVVGEERIQAPAVARVKEETAPTKKSRGEARRKLGFCENCQEQFESFEEHVRSKRHRKFAIDDRHFQALDALIGSLRRPLRMS